MIWTLMLQCCLLFGAETNTLSLTIDNVQSTEGQLLIAVYDRSEGYMETAKARFKKAYSVSKTGTVTLQLPALPAGNYAISCVHDLNANGSIDKNWAGVPTEPYGFSNGVRPKFRAPTWEETRFWFSGQVVKLRVERW
jgi:uncharacterized protein (DUF2141 family)